MTGDERGPRVPSGEYVLRSFFRLLKIVRLHDPEHPMIIKSIADFVHAVGMYGDEEYLDIQISRWRFYIQKKKLAFGLSDMAYLTELLQYFAQRGLQGFRFHASIQEAPPADIASFINLLNRAEKQEEPLSWLFKQLEAENYTWVKILNEADTVFAEHTAERLERGRNAYSWAMTSINEVTTKISQQQRAGIKKAKMVIQNMIDILYEEDTILLGLSTIRNYDDYAHSHSVNVALLSMCLGKRIGLSKMSLEWLGISGLFHDLGKLVIPHELMMKSDTLTQEEFNQIREHPVNSVIQIIKLNVSGDLKAKIMLPPFEHHMNYDLSGYPKIDGKKSVSLFGRILTIADVYDGITSPRAYRPTTLSPDHVLRIMFEGSEKQFDPILLKVFANMLGVYPIGTLLILDSKEICLVKETPVDYDPTRPVAVILKRNEEGMFEKGEVINLAERDPRSGDYLKNIVKCDHPSNYGIQPADFLF